jgi:hypothetical protein
LSKHAVKDLEVLGTGEWIRMIKEDQINERSKWICGSEALGYPHRAMEVHLLRNINISSITI